MKYVFLIVSFFSGWVMCDLYQSKSREMIGSRPFGELYIPLLSSCEAFVGEGKISHESIEDYSVFRFDMDIHPNLTPNYLQVMHKGFPDEALSYLYNKISPCIPNASTEYASGEMLSLDLQEYFLKSKLDRVYIEISKGKAIAYFSN